MPTYDYRCQTCNSHFEYVQSFHDDPLVRCPGKRSGGPVTTSCTSPGKGKVVKVFSKVGIAFKGDGFYRNDHGSAARKSSSDGTSESSEKRADTNNSKASDKGEKASTTGSDKTSSATSSSGSGD